MGQRLNMEVCYDGEVLANAYYHWSAYTSSSLCVLKEVLDAYEKRTEINPLRVAVEILQATGAGVNESEKTRIANDPDGRFLGIEFRDAIDRNEGLLAVTEEGIENTRRWEEGRVTVDISTEEFIFSVMWVLDDREYSDGKDPEEVEEIPDAEFDFDAPCPFIDYEKYAKAIHDHPGGVRIDEDTVLCWIE